MLSVLFTLRMVRMVPVVFLLLPVRIMDRDNRSGSVRRVTGAVCSKRAWCDIMPAELANVSAPCTGSRQHSNKTISFRANTRIPAK